MRRRRGQIESLSDGFGALRADYSAAKSSRFRRTRSGVSAMGSGADYHYRSESDYLRMMEIARDMDRNDVIVGQLVDRAVCNCVQEGIGLDPQTGDDGLDAELLARWTAWGEDPEACDVAGELTFHDFEELVPRHVDIDGDVIVLPLDNGRLQVVEAHRLRKPTNTRKNVVHGVLLDDNRRRLQYWLTKDDINPMRTLQRVSDVKQYDARDEDGHRQVFHVYDPKRVTQTRGVTALAPIFDSLGMFEDVNFAKLVQQQVVSCFAIFRQMDVDGGAGAAGAQHGEQSTETLGDGSTRTLEGIAPGMDVTGRPGEKLTGFSPNVPNAEFFEHVRLILTLVGVNLGLPLVMVLMDSTATNFSGWRGAIDQARMGFRRRQRWLVSRLHRQVYLWKLRQWLAEDAAMRTAASKTGVNITSHRFNPPTWPYIEPLKDASADLLRTRNALISQRRRCHERGLDWNDLLKEICEDNAAMIVKAHETAEELNKTYPALHVTWREIAHLPTPDGVKIQIRDEAEVPNHPQTNKPKDADDGKPADDQD